MSRTEGCANFYVCIFYLLLEAVRRNTPAIKGVISAMFSIGDIPRCSTSQKNLSEPVPTFRRAEKTTFDTPTVVSKVGISPFCK